MSASRTMRGGWADRTALEKGTRGRALCRWCNLEVPAGRFTFCSEWCVNEWRLRTDPGYVREQLFARDRSICAMCGADTGACWIELKRSRGAQRQRLLARWGLKRLTRRTLWDADHVLPVCEGGGECDLENLRTLCLICHRRETEALRRRRFPLAPAGLAAPTEGPARAGHMLPANECILTWEET